MTTLGGRATRARASAIPFAVALTLFLGSASLARGTTYYVRESGNDGHDGLSPETAFASIRPTGRLLRNPGDRVIVGPGMYHEGNIQPLGSGTPDAPIVFLADTTGVLTHDPPGPVRIVPPNAKDSTTGFIVYGRHDIQIEGFEVDGAKDAGIQVRPNPRTGVDSARIAVVNNSAGGGRIGIQVTAVDDVSVIGNRLTGNASAGLTLASGATAALRPLVSGNLIEQCRKAGMWLKGSSGGAIAQNELRSNGRNLEIRSTDGLRISGNQILGPGRAGEIFGANLEITDNVIEGDGRIEATSGRLVFAQNRVAGGDFALLIRADATQVDMLENSLVRLYVTGGAQLDLERNDAVSLAAKGVGTITATDNRFSGSVRILRAVKVEAKHNEATTFTARASEVLMQDNELAGSATIGGLGGAQGLLLEDVIQARVRNNVIFSNREAGILLRDAPRASVVNNLVYANRNNGIAVGLGSVLPTSNAVLMNNTVYANAGWGVAIGGFVAPSTGTVILNNILQLNQRGGIAAGVESLLGLTIGFNLNDDRYGDDVLPSATDFVADPKFVAPAGADGVLGGEGFADDDFHLQPTSPAIDAGSATAAELGITGSAVAGLASDQGIVDLGYHYGVDAQ